MSPRLPPYEQKIEPFLSFFDTVAAAMSITGIDGTMVKVNQAYCDFLGYSEEELLRLKVLDFTHPEDRELTEARFREAREGKQFAHYEKRYLRKDGKTVWGLVSTSWVREGPGPTPYCLGLVQDITARKEMEQSLRESERRFRAIFENAGAGLYTLSLKSRFLQVNPALCYFFGYTEEELLGMALEEVTHPDDQDLTRRTIKKALSGPPYLWHYEKRYRRKDGVVLWAHVSGAWQLDDAGQPTYAIGLVQDITERKRSEVALHTSEARYRRLFEANAQPMWIFDLETLQFLAVNDAAMALYGYSREEFLATTIKDIRPPEDVPSLMNRLAEIKAGLGQEWTRHRCKNGRLIEVEIHAHNIDFDGRKARVVLAHDITEKRRAEERMRLDAAALMSTRDAILITDRSPRIISVNPAFSEITGYTEADILGEHPRLLSSSRHDDAFFSDMWATLSQRSHWQGEIWGRRKDGEMFPGWLSVSAVANHEGNATHFVGVITDLTKLRKSEERLQYLANYDALTDLPKRQALESVLQHAVERARRKKKRLALLVLDLDQFKTVNESFGYKIGDEVLISVVQRLRNRVRAEDALSRLAGDGFALVLEGIEDYSDVEVVAREVQALLEAPFPLPEGHQVYLRASVGISVFPQDGNTAQDLLRGAEAAVNLAKERGGDQLCYCTSELNAQARIRLELQTELRRALERNEFILHYQPKVDLVNGRIVGSEALLRWDCPGKGLIPPLQFIPVAEKTGLIVPLGAWVIDDVCRQIRKWYDEGLENINVAVNVSARQFRSGQIEELVSAALQKHGVDPRCLMIELTESMLMDDPEEAIHRITALRRIGVRVSLDDFGTGYSSLGYLGRFPIDQLKIDRSFIIDIVTDPNAATIATSVIALAHRMRLKVVAEGVETEAQLGYLRQNGCDEMQGFYFSKPIPAEEFAALLHQGKTLPQGRETTEKPTLLIVNDEPRLLTSLHSLLWEEGYRVLTAGSGREGLDLLAKNAVQVILTVQRMPEMSGTEFLSRVRTLHPNAVRMILSTEADLPVVTESVNEGSLYKFLPTPWKDDDLREQIRDAFAHYQKSIKTRGGHPAGVCNC